jgi:hypothetical protein
MTLVAIAFMALAQTKKMSSDEAIIRASIARIDKAYASMDAAAASASMSKDYTNHCAWKPVANRSAVTAGIKSIMKGSDSISIGGTITKITVRNGKATVEMKKTIDTKYRVSGAPHKDHIDIVQTQTWNKRSGTWWLTRTDLHHQKELVDGKTIFNK